MSDLRIDREGKWYYGEMEMSRRDIIALFYQNLAVDDFGCFFIEFGSQRYPVVVEDKAYAVWAVYKASEGAADERGIYLLLSDESIEELDAATLRIGKRNVPYCRVKNSRFEARFSTSGYYQLAELIQHDPQCGEYFLVMKGRRFHIPNTEC